MRSLTPVRRRTRSPFHRLVVPLAVTALAVGAGATGASAAPPDWRARVLPARDLVSEPTFLLDDGTVVGTDYATEVWGQGRPWVWSAATGRRQLGLAGATWALVADAGSATNIVGTLYSTDASGAQRSVAVRWQDRRPVPLLPDAAGDTVADAASPAGDVAVREFAPGREAGWLLSPGRPPQDMGFILVSREWAVSLNSARQAVFVSAGPGTIGPAGFSVWQDGARLPLGISGIRDWPACVAHITESGYVAGSQYLFGSDVLRQEAVRWRDGVRTVLPADGMSAAVACTPSGVNEAGHVVGSLLPVLPRPGEPDPGSPPARAVIWRDGAPETLATDTATETVRPVGVTAGDVVLAQLGTPDGARTGAAVFSAGVRRNLPVPAGLTDVQAVDINERNEAVGSGVRTAPDGSTRRVTIVWTPVRR